jgi:hypothetical protein
MPDKSAAPAAKSARQRARARRWLILFPFGFVVGGAAALAWWHNAPAKRLPKSLDGKLTVLVRPPDRTIDPVPVDQPGALPVVSGGAMCIDAQLDEPAFIYLIWIDSRGHVLPLYPWNNETLEVMDVNEPPPTRRATKLVFSPLLGRVWTFGDQPGMETVVVLARRTPLPSDVKLGSIFESALIPSAAATNTLTTIKLGSGPPQSKTTQLGGTEDAANAKSAGKDLPALLQRLHDHFDFLEAAQFPHKADYAERPEAVESKPRQ